MHRHNVKSHQNIINSWICRRDFLFFCILSITNFVLIVLYGKYWTCIFIWMYTLDFNSDCIGRNTASLTEDK